MSETSFTTTLSQRHRFAKLFHDDGAFTTTLLAMYLDEFGTEGLNWSPATVEIAVNELCGAYVKPKIYERLMTGIALLTTDVFYWSVPDFAKFCCTLAGNYVPSDQLILPDAEDIAWGITEGLLISPPDEKSQSPFSNDIAKYVGWVLDNEGIINPPDVLKIGVREDPNMKVTGFSQSDPEMFQSIWQFEQEKSDAILDLISAKVKGLMEQLKELPLSNEDSRDVIEQMVKTLKLRPVAPQTL